MLSFLPAPVIGVINSILLGINTLFWCILLYIPAILKLIIPITGFRVLCTKVIIWIAEAWVACQHRLDEADPWHELGRERGRKPEAGKLVPGIG